jgi:hypothetical protein
MTHIRALEGQRLGPYEVVEPLGQGGMAVVYKAFQPTLERYVAVKVLPPHFLYEPGVRQRFDQEAKTIARLEHPHILSIYDYGQQGDILYLVMPVVVGGTLSDWLAGMPTLELALRVFSKLLGALDYAHAAQVVHRDIKPSVGARCRRASASVATAGRACDSPRTPTPFGRGAPSARDLAPLRGRPRPSYSRCSRRRVAGDAMQ